MLSKNVNSEFNKNWYDTYCNDYYWKGNSKQGFVFGLIAGNTLIDPNGRNVDLFPDLPERINKIKTS